MMGSFLSSDPVSVVTVEMPPVLPPGCAYDVRITPRAQDDGVLRIVRDGLEIVAVHPDGRVETHAAIKSLTEELEER